MRGDSMKIKYIAGFLCVLMLVSIPLTTVQAHREIITQTQDAEPQSLIGVTFIAGIIMNPQTIGKYVQAKAIIMAYYDRGLIFKDSGVAMGFKNVRFKDGDLLYMSEPGTFGLVQVAGICTGFSIQK